MNSTSRIDKYKAFKKFFDSSKLDFTNVSGLDKRSEELNKYYSLCICPGGSQGGGNDRLIEVFYGQRPFDTKRTNPYDRSSISVLTEQGARLHYNRLDNGQVLVILYPAQTENSSTIEDAVIIERNLDSRNLSKFHKKHFMLLNSYMRCTSLDGEPTFIDKLKVFWLRLNNSLIVNGKNNPTKFSSGLIGVLKFSASVGLSGFLLAIIMAATAAPAADFTGELQQLNKTAQAINSQCGKIANTLTELRLYLENKDPEEK